jgi:hypothetical protein
MINGLYNSGGTRTDPSTSNTVAAGIWGAANATSITTGAQTWSGVSSDHWSGHCGAGVRYFSGTATYRKSLTIPAAKLAGGRRVELDLGQVAVMAEVRLNGRGLGVLWKPPFCVDVTEAIHPGENALEVQVAWGRSGRSASGRNGSWQGNRARRGVTRSPPSSFGGRATCWFPPASPSTP